LCPCIGDNARLPRDAQAWGDPQAGGALRACWLACALLRQEWRWAAAGSEATAPQKTCASNSLANGVLPRNLSRLGAGGGGVYLSSQSVQGRCNMAALGCGHSLHAGADGGALPQAAAV